MIVHIHGKLVEKTPTHLIIDCGGVGYHINISLHTYSLLPNTDFIKVYTYLQIKEDAHTLFGFIEKSEREIFKLLLSVSGIGASIARTMLSSLDPKQVTNAIASGDVGVIYIVAIFLLSLLASVYCAIFVKSDVKFRIFKIFIIVIWLASLFYFGQMKGVSSFAEMYAIFSSLLVFFICLKK